MAKRKKKPTGQELHKVNMAHYRNEFYRKFKLVIDTFCGKDIYPLIPQKVLDDVYSCRSAPFKYKIAPGNTVPKNILTDTKVVLSNIFRLDKIILPPHNLEISITDFFTVVFTITIFQVRIKETDFECAKQVKEALLSITSNEDALNKAGYAFNKALLSFGLGYCDLGKTLYLYNHEQILPKLFPGEIENIILINSIAPETISVKIDGTSRPVIRVGWAIPSVGIQWVSIKPSVLNINSPFAEIPLPVYIQSHALNRLSERIDCFWTGFVQYNMYNSLLDAKVFRDSHNKLLIEYQFFGTKAGYFRVDMIDGVLVIRTFLFITNNGTPEGQLLEKNTGLQKLDKSYLAIDKLSTFMTSDLDKNEEIQRIFKTSGCQCLLDLYDKMKPMVTKHANGFDSNLMLNYLNIHNLDIAETEVESHLKLVES
ncbi:MAG: hypothetical protein HXX16_19835 [Bacteroidales bacterium]|nr:hypothetical protein [Bacteroidales bacterium]